MYCPRGGFFIDPCGPVERAIVTHAHGDHARAGSRVYLTAAAGAALLQARLGDDASIESVAYGTAIDMNGVRVSLHPAGHILGSAQIRIEHGGEVWVVSGDYKLEPDATCAPLEPIRCHTYVTESTFGLPIFRWPAPEIVMGDIEAWWRSNQETGKASVLFAYSLGKSQRVLAGIDATIGPIFTHGAVERYCAIYRASGVALAATAYAGATAAKTAFSRALIVAPPSANGTPWMRRFGAVSTAYASGWMRIRGTRRRRSLDRGFVLSDHADWNGLLRTIRQTGASRVWVTHGYRAPLAQWLQHEGIDATAIETRYEGELDEAEVEPSGAPA